jgi:hypothetical protein
MTIKFNTVSIGSGGFMKDQDMQIIPADSQRPKHATQNIKFSTNMDFNVGVHPAPETGNTWRCA